MMFLFIRGFWWFKLHIKHKVFLIVFLSVLIIKMKSSNLIVVWEDSNEWMSEFFKKILPFNINSISLFIFLVSEFDIILNSRSFIIKDTFFEYDNILSLFSLRVLDRLGSNNLIELFFKCWECETLNVLMFM